MFSKSAFLCIALIISAIVSKSDGQTLYEQKFYGPYIMLFQLDEKQADFAIHNQHKLDTAWLYTHPVGKVRTDSVIPLHHPQPGDWQVKPHSLKDQNFQFRQSEIWNIITNGYFIEVRVNSINMVQYRILEVPIFFTSVIRVGYETFVFVEDSAGLPVNDAFVKLDTHQCRFDKSIGGYRIPKDDISGFLFVKKNDAFVYKMVHGYQAQGNNSKPPKDHYRYAKIHYQGYLVTNKPKYKPGDSLFFKAFIINKKAKPLKEKCYARMYQNNTGKAVEFELKPDPRGAYNGFFVIGDSFNTDDNLGIVLLNSKRQMIKSETVYLENYELRDIEFSITTDRFLASPGTGLKVYAKATNKTGLPIMDGSIELVISISQAEYAGVDSLVIPYKKWREYYKITVQTDPSGTTIFELPDSLFLPLKASYVVTGTLTTSDNEIKSATAVFNYETTRDRLEAELNRDTLKVERLYNMQSVRRKMRIKYFSRYDQIADSIFYTPFRQYLAPNIYYAQIYQGDTLVGTYYRSVAIPEIKGQRSHDSIIISFHSAPDVPVYFRVYRNNELVHSGRDTALNYKAYDKSKNSYHLQYGVLAGKVTDPVFFSKSFHLKERELHVEIKQPGVIYPGQEVAVEVFVKDAWGRPVKKVNLTAYAVNMQLEGIKKPDVPYLGLEKIQKYLPLHRFTVTDCKYYYNGYFAPWSFDKLGLYDNALFHMVYPKKGFEVLYDTTPEHTTEIAFYNHGSGWQSPVQYVIKNDTLIATDFGTPTPRVLRTEAGSANFTFRLYGHLFSVKDVIIKKGMKNFICINADSVEILELGDTISNGKFTPAEYAMLQKHMLYFRYNSWQPDTLAVKINGKTRYGFAPYTGYSTMRGIYTQKPYFNKNSQKTEYYQADNFQVLGPILPGSKVEFSWKNGYAHEFNFQSLHTISFTKDEAVSQPLEEMNSGFQYFPRYRQDVYSLNSFWWDPDKDPVILNANLSGGRTSDPVEYLPQFDYKSYYPQQTKYNSSLHLYMPYAYSLKRLWLFNLDDSSLSTLTNYPTITYVSEAGLNAYRYSMMFTQPRSGSRFLLVGQHTDTSWLVKPLVVDSSVYLFLTVKDTDFRKLRTTEFINFDRMVKILGKEPFVKFEDTPTITKDLSMVRLKSKNGITSLEGTVNGPDLNYVVNNAFVILEKNGFFIRGAITNADGRFLMDSLNAGEYMLKIKGANYHYWISYKLQLDAGRLHILHVKMKPYARFQYTSFSRLTEGDKIAYAFDSDGDAVFSFGNSYSAAGAPASASMIESQSNSGVMITSAKPGRQLKYKLADRSVSMQPAEERDDDENGKYYYRSWDLPMTSGLLDNADSTAIPGLYTLNFLSTESARRIRRDFKDHAYWIPNLNTNKAGYATYSVRFPDNITSWQTYVPAMDGKRHSGLGELVVKAYKPVSSTLALPYFLTEGDMLVSQGRIMNYSNKNVSGRYTLLVDSVGINKTISIEKYYSDSILICAAKAGTFIRVENGFEMQDGYRDIQSRTIPVQDASVLSGKSDFSEVNGDTSLMFTWVEGDAEQSVILYNQQLAMVLEMLKFSDKIAYPDNFTAADKLNALLIQKYVSQKLNIPFDKEKETEAALKKLKNAQRDNGSFGWYKKSPSNNYLTSYTAMVFYKAETMGYGNNGWLNAARYFEKQLPNLYGAEALLALYTLKKINRDIKYKELMVRINPAELGFADKLRYQWLLEAVDGKGNKKLVLEHLNPSEKGDLYVSDNPYLVKYSVFNDDAENTYLAWDLLLQMNQETETRKLLVSYLANTGSMRWHGGILAAECIVKEYEKQNKLDAELKPVIYANGKLVPFQAMPATYAVKRGDTLRITHSGAPVFVLVNRSFKTFNPVSQDNAFRITTSINGKNDSADLTGGKPVSMKVKVFAKTNHSNVVVEIPIPAGCVYDRKIQNESPYEQHREYAYDRVYIYLDELPFGYAEFTVPLVPKFTGTFRTAPARVALMYYSDRAAYTKGKVWRVR